MDATSWAEVATLQRQDRVYSVSLSHAGDRVAVGGRDKMAVVYALDFDQSSSSSSNGLTDDLVVVAPAERGGGAASPSVRDHSPLPPSGRTPVTPARALGGGGGGGGGGGAAASLEKQQQQPKPRSKLVPSKIICPVGQALPPSS